MRSIGWVAEALDAPIHHADPSRSWSGVAVDSRTVEPGQLFVALAGDRTDGHRFLDDAFRRGASGAIVREIPPDAPTGLVNCVQVADPLKALQRLARRRRAELAIPIVGITGSAGKTTAKELTHRVLSERYSVHRAPGNRNTEIGLPMALVNMSADADVGIVEMGLQQPGDIRTLCEVARPTHGVLTSIGDAHIGFFSDQTALAREKWALMEALPDNGRAVLNLDAPFAAEWSQRLTCERTTFGLDHPNADVGVAAIDDTRLDGLRISVSINGDIVPLQTCLLGRHNAYTVLAAVALGQATGISVGAIQRAVAEFRPVSHRMELKPTHRGGLVLDDTYNASPAATRAALTTLARLQTDYRKVAVIGDMRELGDQAEAHHEALAEVIGGLAIDRVITIGDLARHTSDALRRRRNWPVERARHAADLEHLAGLCRDMASNDTLTLIKGSRAMGLDRLVERLVVAPEAGPP